MVIAQEQNQHLKKSVEVIFTKPIWYTIFVPSVVDTSSLVVALLRPE